MMAMRAKIKKEFGVFEIGAMTPVETHPTRALAMSAMRRMARENEKKINCLEVVLWKPFQTELFSLRGRE